MLMQAKMQGMMVGRQSTAAALTTISYIGHTTSTSSSDSTLTASSDILEGDFLLWFQGAGITGLPSAVEPTDFTLIQNQAAASATRAIASYKIADGSEASASYSIMAENRGVRLSVYRGDIPFTSATINSKNTQGTSGDPTSQSCTAGSGTPPLIVFGLYFGGAAAVSPRTITPGTWDNEGPGSRVYLNHLIFNSSPVNQSIDMDDEGAANTLISFYVTFNGA